MKGVRVREVMLLVVTVALGAGWAIDHARQVRRLRAAARAESLSMAPGHALQTSQERVDSLTEELYDCLTRAGLPGE